MLRSDAILIDKPADVLEELARRLHRLRPDHRDPHRFHEEKSEIAHALRLLARRVN